MRRRGGHGLAVEGLERRDCPAGISIGDVSVDEGTAASGMARLTVTLSERASSTVTVDWATVDGTATVADRDYRPASGTLVFAAGQKSKTIAVTVLADATVESDETFVVRLSNPVNATLLHDTGTVTIRNDDVAAFEPPTVSVAAPAALPERNVGRSEATFVVSLSGAVDVPVSVDYATADGSAKAEDGDYLKTSGRVTFAPGETTKNVTVGVLGDTRIEQDETFQLVLSSPVRATLGTASATATILNDDVRPAAPPVVTVVATGGASVLEGNAGDATATFEVRLSSAAAAPVTVTYATADGTARVADSDYRSQRGTLIFAPGETVKQVSVAVIGDRKAESDETFSLGLLSATGASVDRGSKAVAFTILDDDTPPAISVDNVTLTEGDAGSAPLTFTITLNKAWSQEVTVAYATRDGSATVADSDYVATSGTLTFAAGETSKTVSVTVNGDTKGESNETFSLVMSSPTNATLGKVEGVGQIRNDDAGAWTIMVYMTGENLNTYAFQDINEMERALTGMPAGVNIVVSWDQPKTSVGTAYATGGGSQAAWRTYGRSVLTPDVDSSKIASTFDLSFGEKNTGDAATLTDFVQWAAKQAPAEHYLLQMWGHGGGLAGSQFDSESGGDPIEIGEIAGALAAPGMPTIDLVSYDNCLMAMAEVGYAISSRLTGLYVASEELVNGTGQDYTTAYSALKSPANPFSVTAGQIAASMVTSYGTQYQNDPTDDTFSAATTSGYAGLASALSQFVTSSLTLTSTDRTAVLTAARNCVGYDEPSFRDVGTFMANVSATTSLPAALRSAADGVTQAITAMIATKTADHRHSSGVSIYLPSASNDPYLSTYTTTAAAFCQATNWNTFAKWLATGSRAASAGTAAGSPARPQSTAVARAAQAIAAARNDWATFVAGSTPAVAGSAPASRRAVQRAFAAMA